MAHHQQARTNRTAKRSASLQQWQVKIR